MILRLVFVVLFTFTCLSVPVQAQKKVECPPTEVPVINILPYRSEIIYDFTKPAAYLTQKTAGKVYSPYEAHQATTTYGLSNPEISFEALSVASAKRVKDVPQKACVFVKAVQLQVNIDPKVYVASEHPKGSCMHKAILEHEMKHVRVNREVINEYSLKLGKALQATVNARKSGYGPMPVAQVSQVQENVTNSFNEIVEKYNTEMMLAVKVRQRNVDTIEEYASVGADCKKDNTKK